MPNYNFTLTNWVDNSAVGADSWTNPGYAQSLDGSDATLTSGVQQEPLLVLGGMSMNQQLPTPGYSHYLMGTSPTPIPAWAGNEVLNTISITIQRYTTSGSVVLDNTLNLVVGGVVLTAVNKANTTLDWPSSLTSATYTFASGDLTTLGIAKSSIDSGFGVALTTDEVGLNGGTVYVDQISGSFATSYSGQTTDVLPWPISTIPGIGIQCL